MSDSFATPWTVARQAPLSMGFPRQEFWNGLPFPSPRNFPNQGLNPRLLRGQADSLPLNHLGSHMARISMQNKARQATQRLEREKRKEKGLISEVPRGFHQSLTPKLTSVSLVLYSKEKVTSGWPVDVILERSSSGKKRFNHYYKIVRKSTAGQVCLKCYCLPTPI